MTDQTARPDTEPTGDVSASPPSPLALPPILVIAPIVSFVDGALGGRLVEDVWWSLAAVAASAALIGLPFLFWAIDHRRTSVTTFLTLGAVAGAIPLMAALASGMLGRYVRGGMGYVTQVLRAGAPIPTVGHTRWSVFLTWEARYMLIGALSAVVYWAVFVRRRSPARSTQD